LGKTFLAMAFASLAYHSYAQPKGGMVESLPSKPTTTWAIIIGISDYENLPPLNFAHRDALAFKDWLTGKQQIDSNKIFCFINDEASSVNIFDKLYLVHDSAKAGDQFVFYFSGHGDWESKLSDNALLLLAKAPKQNYLRHPDQYISCHILNEVLKKLTDKNIRTVLIADACHSGKLSGGSSGAETTNLQLKRSWKNDLRILSCMPDEISFEDPKWGGGRGVFSYFFTEALNGRTRADTGSSFDLSVSELRSYLEENLKRETNGKQNPLFEGDTRTALFRISPFRKDSICTDTSFLVNQDPEKTKLYLQLQFKFHLSLESKFLVAPAGSSALDYYKQLSELDSLKSPLDKKKLLAAIKEDFSSFAELFYNNEGYPKESLSLLRDEIKAAIELSGSNEIFHNDFRIKKLFLDACLLSYTGPQKNSIPESDLLAAADSLLKAVEISPFEPLLYKKLSECYSPIDKLKAILWMEEFLDLVPRHAEGWNALGMLHYERKDFQNAILAFTEAIRLDGGMRKYYFNIGKAYEKKGDACMASNYFEKAASVDASGKAVLPDEL
jgi:tetratricopeptide (TPR) repeat protein